MPDSVTPSGRNWRAILLAVCPKAKARVLDPTAAAMDAVCARAALTSDDRIAAFIGQIAWESDHFTTTIEYASGSDYEGRADLGNVAAGDGRRFKGRGLIQITGRRNYRIYGAELLIDLEANPEQAALFPVAALTAAVFWARNDLNPLADAGRDIAITKRVNGGLNGLAGRLALTQRARSALAHVGAELGKRVDETRQEAEGFRKGGHVAAGGGIAAGGTHVAAHGSSLGILAFVAVAILVAAGIAYVLAARRDQAADILAGAIKS
jgi:putative chitinase